MKRPAVPATAFPAVTLTNGVLTATVYTPDAAGGYYRGARFDWSGIIGQVALNGHTFFGELRHRHDPLGPDCVAGPVEEFGMNSPLGYAEADLNGTFIKIGVGHLRKLTGQAYFFNNPYPVVRAAPWTVTQSAAMLRFRQVLDDPRGWGYAYTKVVRLEPGRAVLTIDHELHNTGARPVETDHYSHNMFRFDDRPIGCGYRIGFPFVPGLTTPTHQAAVAGREVVYLPEVLEGALFTPLTGWSGPADNAATVTHPELGMALTVSIPVTPSKYNLYAESTVLCPEPFIPIRLQPGETLAWTATFAFEAP